MSIVEFDGPLSWSLDESETGESTKIPWKVVVGQRPVKLNARYLRSHGKIGDCEESTLGAKLCVFLDTLTYPHVITYFELVNLSSLKVVRLVSQVKLV